MSLFFYVSLSSWVISLTGFGAGVTNLNEPPRALAASTIAWVFRSRECDLLSVLWIYPRIFLCIFIVYRRVVFFVVVFCHVLMCVGCFGLVVSTCQVIGWKDPSEDTLTWWGDYLHKAQVEESVCVYFSLVCLCCYVFLPPPAPYTIYISYAYDTI